MEIAIPFAQCDLCAEANREGKILLAVERRRLKISRLELYCSTCDWENDLLESTKTQSKEAAKRARRISKELSSILISIKDELPKDAQSLRAAISNPTHPFTAAALTGLLLLMMELSGFGVFMAVTWVLGNLILFPPGWVLVPIVVAIAFHFKRHFERQRLEELRLKNQQLVDRLHKGEISQEEFEQLQRQLFHDHLAN